METLSIFMECQYAVEYYFIKTRRRIRKLIVKMELNRSLLQIPHNSLIIHKGGFIKIAKET